MKNIKKIISAGLVLSMSLSMAGCMGGGKLASKKLAASAKKYGCEKFDDVDDFVDEMEEDDLEDGIYITVDGSDCKDILKDNDLTEDMYDKSIKNATFVYFNSEDDGYGAYIMCFTFGSKKDAQDYYDDVVESIEDIEDECADTDSDDGEGKGVTYFVFEGNAGWYNLAEGIYLSGNNVLVIVGAGLGNDDYNDCIDDVSGCYDIVLPSDL